MYACAIGHPFPQEITVLLCPVSSLIGILYYPQLRSILGDIHIVTIKTGMPGNADIVVGFIERVSVLVLQTCARSLPFPLWTISLLVLYRVGPGAVIYARFPALSMAHIPLVIEQSLCTIESTSKCYHLSRHW